MQPSGLLRSLPLADNNKKGAEAPIYIKVYRIYNPFVETSTFADEFE